MEKLIYSSTLLVLFVLLACGNVFSQDEANIASNDLERTKKLANNSPGDSLHTPSPLVAPDQPRSPHAEQPDRFTQGGAFYGTYGLGIDYTMRGAGSHLYGNLFVSSLTNPERRIQDARYMAMAGLTVGYETRLNPGRSNPRGEVLRSDVDGMQYYVRIGPGLGVGGIARADNNELEVHPYIHTTASLGALKTLSRHGAFYAEFGGRLAWFPTLSEMHFIGGPHITFGFHLLSESDIPAVAY